MNNNFTCKQCGKERNDYPRYTGKDGVTCWECASLDYYNDDTIKAIDKLTKVAKQHVTSNPLHSEYMTSIINNLSDIFEEYESNDGLITSSDIEQIEGLLRLILDKIY